MDIVYIDQLHIQTVIGIYDWEKEIKQEVCLDLQMANDNRKGAASNDVDDTLDYMAVSKRLIAFVGDHQFLLMENLAERCADIVMQEFGVPWLRLKAAKPGAVAGAAAVGVIIERGGPRPDCL